jgi:hypothetical protein
MYRKNRFCCHTRESGYPEVFGFKEYWIPDKDLGNDDELVGLVYLNAERNYFFILPSVDFEDRILLIFSFTSYCPSAV